MPARAATPVDGGDADPLVPRLAAALELGRWLSARARPALQSSRTLQLRVAGAASLWTASRVQVVVDDQGRFCGVDLGATATATWNRLSVQQVLRWSQEGDPELVLRPRWLPYPAGPPEQSLGLYHGPGELWPDREGEIQFVR
jgi:hypothetical protein